MMFSLPQQRWRGSLGGMCPHGQPCLPQTDLGARRPGEGQEVPQGQQSLASPGAFRPAPLSQVLAPAWASCGGAVPQLVRSRGPFFRASASSLVPWAGQQGVGQAAPLSCAPPWAPPPPGQSASMMYLRGGCGVWRRAACQSQRVLPPSLFLQPFPGFWALLVACCCCCCLGVASGGVGLFPNLLCGSMNGKGPGTETGSACPMGCPPSGRGAEPLASPTLPRPPLLLRGTSPGST